jgi:hypothetical protein
VTLEAQPSQSSETPATTEVAAEPVTEPTTPRTIEEVEAEWRHRTSQRDKAHAEETKVLREQLGRFEAAENARRSAEETQRQANMTADQRMQDQIASLQRQLEDRDKAYTVELRRTRFPNIAAELDDSALAVMDEGKLAALDAKLGSGQAASPPSLIDPNSAARTVNGSPTTTPGEKTTDQLKADLERFAPEFIREIAPGHNG